MARIKATPRVAQPDLESSASASEVHTISSKADKIQPLSSDFINRRNQKSANLLARFEMLPFTRARPDLEAAPEPPSLADLRIFTCPQCFYKFPQMTIQDLRKHVESCTRPVTGESESTVSSLSPPPGSQQGDPAVFAADELPDLDHLSPYVADQFTIYPKGDVPGDDVIVKADAHPRTCFGKLTDPQHFFKSLLDADEIPYDVLYGRVKSAARALVHWQNEWIDLDRFIEATEAVPSLSPAKPHKNPRVPKDTQIGIGYQDELESFAYGFEYQYHQKKVGLQNPEKQRHANGANQGRELRQRVPTQKAAEADLSTSPSSDEGVSTRRRGRAQKAMSQSRDVTPATTAPSGRKRGRPARTAAGGASRLQELQREEGVEYDTLETTERWLDPAEDVLASRPGTSDSNRTGFSDDVRIPPGRSLGRGRKRQNTSDFEDALPSHKRIRKPNPATTNGFSSEELPEFTRDSDGELIRVFRPNRPDEDGPTGLSAEETFASSVWRGQHSKDVHARPGSNYDLTPNQSGKGSKIVTLKTSNGTNRTPANAALSRSTVTDPLPTTSSQLDIKDGPKISRASLNMRRRWAAKKEAEAKGLPVPKIGRYPKGESAPSTPDVAGNADPFNSLNQVGGRKRKRDEGESIPANVSISGSVSVPPEALVAIKKRGGRPKKPAQPANGEPSSEKQTIQDTIRDVNQLENMPSGNEDARHEVTAPKRKGGRPRKKVLDIGEVAKVTENLVRGMPAGIHRDRNTSHDRNDANSELHEDKLVEQVENIEYADEQQLSGAAVAEEDVIAPQLRRTGRVRRQTSAALSASSQANTFRSGRSSQKSTVTPTPGPMQQHSEETVIKQEAAAGSTLSKERGRQLQSAALSNGPEGTHTSANVTEDGAPLAKRRRHGRSTNIVSTGSSPVSIPFLQDRTTPHEVLEVVRNGGSHKIRSSNADSHASETLSNHQVNLVEPSLRKRGGRKPPTIDTAVADADSDESESPVETTITKKGTRTRKNADADPSSEMVMEMSVKREDISRRLPPLTTRARSSGHLNSADDVNVVQEVINVEPPKKKGSWGGKRVKGVFSSGRAPKPIVGSMSDVNDGIDGVGPQVLSNTLDDYAGIVQEAPKKQLGGPRSKKGMPLSPEELGSDFPEQQSQHVSPRRKRILSKTVTPVIETDLQGAAVETSPNVLSRPKRAATIFDATTTESGIHGRRSSVIPSAQSRPKKSIPAMPSPEIDGGELDNDVGPSNASARPKRALKTRVLAASTSGADDSDASADVDDPTGSARADTNEGAHRKKRKWAGKRARGIETKSAEPTVNDREPVNAESNHEDSESEGTRKEKKQLAAKASKSLKNSQSMKARWANGSMHEIMRRKREANLAKKAAAENAEHGEVEDLIGHTVSAPASAATKRKSAHDEAAARAPKRRRTMNATMDGPADIEDDYDAHNASSSGPTSPTDRKMSEYERYQQLSSPLRSAHSRRKRRPAALRASQSFSKFTDDGDDVEIMDDNNEDIETEIKKQFDSEYEHFRGLESSNILQGKRKRKPVMNLEEAMRIEAGDEDDFLLEG